MTKCADNRIQELLPLVREGALEGPERELVEGHLAVCTDCREELALLRLVADEPVPDPGEMFWAAMPARIYREVREQEARRREGGFSAFLRGLLRHRIAWAAASVLIVAVLGWRLMAPTGQQMDVAAVQQTALSAEETSSDEALDMATLDTDELENIGGWAEKKMAAVVAETDVVTTGGKQEHIYEDLVEMDGASLKRLSTMLDGLKERG